MTKNRKFTLDDHEQKKLDEWLPTVKKLVCERQMTWMQEQIDKYGKDAGQHWQRKLDEIKQGYDKGEYYPYEGAIGGGLTFSFTPTGLGDIIKVKYFEHQIDLTNYDVW